MKSLKESIVFITGASSGIGKACAEQFAALGAKLVLTARRKDRLEKLSQTIKAAHNTEILSIQLDVSDHATVKDTIASLPPEWCTIDILINNAGCALGTDLLQEGDTENWDKMIDTNVKGVLYVTRAVLPGMLERKAGHIINVSSIAGHDHYPRGNVYVATKHAVRALSKSLRLDLLGSGLRVSDIAPGAVETEFSIVRWNDKAKADEFYADFTPLVAEDIADGIVYCATRPPHVDVAELVIYPTAQASGNHLAKGESTGAGLFD